MAKIYLHTGSNIGKRKENLEIANRLIGESVGTILRYSNIYETAAWGLKDQSDFLNQALEVETAYSPIEVLDKIQAIENTMGRVRIKKWGRRLIDIDILFFESEVIKTERLTIPHPFLQQRNFVLAPLSELIPDFFHPLLKATVHQLFTKSEDKLKAEVFLEENDLRDSSGKKL
jgi:2-amino-4-hydroxy-6-hydroxymethyldihydropteridine diphosphokinase